MRKMSPRISSQARREQIVAAALELLGSVSVDKLSTRMVARSVGVSQPALFKHFPSRGAIIEAVMGFVRESLEQSVAAVFDQGGDTQLLVRGLVKGLFRFAEANPGAPRLLFFDAAAVEGAEVGLRGPLGLIVSGQIALVGDLVRGEVEAGGLPAGLDSARSGELLVALVQGELLRWHLGQGGRTLVARSDSLVAFWWAGLLGGQPEGGMGAGSMLGELDVRPLIDQGLDPFGSISRALSELSSAGTLVLFAPFRPDPLLAVLGKRGFAVEHEEPVDGLFTLLIHKSPKSTLDLRDLPAPEPMEAILLAASGMEIGESRLARMPRFPRMLIPRLEERNLNWLCIEEPCGAAVLSLFKPTPQP